MKKTYAFPTILGLFLVLTIVSGVVVFVESLTRKTSSATASSIPKSVRITNVSDTMFTVSWTTDIPTKGAVIVSSHVFSAQTFYDERDVVGKLGSYPHHHVTVRYLDPKTTYSVRIVSEGRTYDQNGKPYEISTGPMLTSANPQIEPAFGKIITKEGLPVEGALVYATLENGQELSTLSKPSGSFVIPLNLTRTQTLDQYLTIAERHTLRLTVLYESLNAQAITDTLNDSPVPTMVLGKTYDFRNQQADAGNIPNRSFEDVSSQTSVLGTTDGLVSLLLPQDGDSLPTQTPLIQGRGVPGNTVTITLGITTPETHVTTVGKDGTFTFSPKNPLPPGKQSVTITTANKNGKLVAITHTFVIFKSATRVLGDATPSATFSPSPSPIVIPTESATPTQTYTLAPSPTQIPPEQEIPTSGNYIPTLLASMIAIVLVLSGFALFL